MLCNRIFKLGIITLLWGFVISCSTAEKSGNAVQDLFAAAEEMENNEHYDMAIPKYQEVKNKYPYSNYATKAELAIANIYFKREMYSESQIAYQSFKELHPKYAEIDFIKYRIGMSYFNQLPETIDRDLSSARDVVVTFDDLVRHHPNSKYISEALENKSKVISMLAQKEEYIADYYYKREMYSSALGRYEELYNGYSGVGLDEKALGKAALCALKIGDNKRSNKYLGLLSKKYPNSEYLKLIAKEASK